MATVVPLVVFWQEALRATAHKLPRVGWRPGFLFPSLFDSNQRLFFGTLGKDAATISHGSSYVNTKVIHDATIGTWWYVANDDPHSHALRNTEKVCEKRNGQMKISTAVL